MIDKKLSDLPLVTTLPLDPDSLLLVSEDDGAGNKTSKAIKFSDLQAAAGPGSWIAPTLNAGWVDPPLPWAPAGYKKDNNGRISLRGLLNYSGAGGVYNIAFTLPVAHRPQYNMRFAVPFFYGGTGSITSFNNWHHATVCVFQNGDVTLIYTPGTAPLPDITIDLASVQFDIV